MERYKFFDDLSKINVDYKCYVTRLQEKAGVFVERFKRATATQYIGHLELGDYYPSIAGVKKVAPCAIHPNVDVCRLGTQLVFEENRRTVQGEFYKVRIFIYVWLDVSDPTPVDACMVYFSRCGAWNHTNVYDDNDRITLEYLRSWLGTGEYRKLGARGIKLPLGAHIRILI